MATTMHLISVTIFFEAGGLEYDKDKDAYIVEDVDYCIDYAMDWKNGTGDFYCDDNNEEKIVDVRLLMNSMITEKRMIDEGGNIGWCKPYVNGNVKYAISGDIVGIEVDGKDFLDCEDWNVDGVAKVAEMIKKSYPEIDYTGYTPEEILSDQAEEMDCRDCPWFLECEAMDD